MTFAMKQKELMEKPHTNTVVQKKASANHTGIPAVMKANFEQSSGFSFDDVQVHYNSERPAKLDALAYTQGNQVYLGPGQEKHLPHELGHVVQQKMGIVHADTRHKSGAMLNTEERLERDADRLGKLNI